MLQSLDTHELWSLKTCEPQTLDTLETNTINFEISRLAILDLPISSEYWAPAPWPALEWLLEDPACHTYVSPEHPNIPWTSKHLPNNLNSYCFCLRAWFGDRNTLHIKKICGEFLLNENTFTETWMEVKGRFLCNIVPNSRREVIPPLPRFLLWNPFPKKTVHKYWNHAEIQWYYLGWSSSEISLPPLTCTLSLTHSFWRDFTHFKGSGNSGI